MTAQHHAPFKTMPTPAPLAMPTQDLSKPFDDDTAQVLKAEPHTRWFRWMTLIPALLTVCVLMSIFYDWFEKDGFVTAEILMLGLVGFSAFWVAISVAAGTVGLLLPRKRTKARQPSILKALDVALLVPIYNEDVTAVFARLSAMKEQLEARGCDHRYAFFILSDTRDEAIARSEVDAFSRLRHEGAGTVPVFYRRRAENTERKTGNIRDWVSTWGGAWDAFITLDADSLMARSSIEALSDDLAGKPQTGMIQTVPRLMGGETLFARVLQFSNNVYGPVLGRGLDRWSADAGNYWGHNAIIRTKAFAKCAGLPKLSGKGALCGTIKSHDFVEAALLRRAGWAVEINPDLETSYEETPQTLLDYVLRDRRWCQGNLQHLKLLNSAGFHAVSRFHMVQGAMAYVASACWFVLLIVWALLGRSESETVFRYFTDTNPLFPVWPQMDAVSRGVVLAFMLSLLLLPKVFGLVATWRAERGFKRHGGRLVFMASAVTEIVFSVLLAPIMMVQHVMGLLRTAFDMDTGWAPQNRNGTRVGLLTLLRFHWVETLAGALLSLGIGLGVISLWLVPIAVSLVLAAPIAMLVSAPLRPLAHGFGVPPTKVLATAELLSPDPVIVAYESTKQSASLRAPQRPHATVVVSKRPSKWNTKTA
ncbi:MAG: glucans biosynthesis glucosyltransferase MdoH [Pseudomonadota bacterium]